MINCRYMKMILNGPDSQSRDQQNYWKKIVLVIIDFYLITMLEKKSYISVHIILCIICALPEILINICIKSVFCTFFECVVLVILLGTKMFLRPVDTLVLYVRSLVYFIFLYLYCY